MKQIVYEVINLNDDGMYSSTIGVFLTKLQADIVAGSSAWKKVNERAAIIDDDIIYLLDPKRSEYFLEDSQKQAKVAEDKLKEELMKQLTPTQKKKILGI